MQNASEVLQAGPVGGAFGLGHQLMPLEPPERGFRVAGWSDLRLFEEPNGAGEGAFGQRWEEIDPKSIQKA